MTTHSKSNAAIKYLLCTILILLLANKLEASVEPDLALKNENLKILSTDLHRNVLPLLTLVKEYNLNFQYTTIQVVSATNAGVVVREVNNIAADTIYFLNMNEEYEVLTEQDFWYHISLQDGRNGWVQDQHVQVREKQSKAESSPSQKRSSNARNALISQINRYKLICDALFERTKPIVKDLETTYQTISELDKENFSAEYKEFLEIKQKIDKYQSYIDEYYAPVIEEIKDTDNQQNDIVKNLKKFSGDVAMNLGKSRYQALEEFSSTSRNIAANGVYQATENTKIFASLNNQKEIIQTPFKTTDLGTGISSKEIRNLQIDAKLGYNNYSDETLADNSYHSLSSMLNLNYKLKEMTSVYGNLSFLNKQFGNDGGNDYKGTGIILGTILKPNTREQFKFQLRQNNQKSDIVYLSFNKFNPQFSYLKKKTPKKSFSTLLDFDKLTYSDIENPTDFKKYKLNFNWRKSMKGKISNTSFKMAAKQYPNNASQDYVRIGIFSKIKRKSPKDNRVTNNSFSSSITYFMERDSTSLNDFLDLRYNSSTRSKTSFFTFNVTSRIWNNFKDLITVIEEGELPTGPDHTLDFYSEFGPKYNFTSNGHLELKNLQLGFILGAHALINLDEDFITRNGNSARGGVSLQGNIKILKASLNVAATYEYSVLLTKSIEAGAMTDENVLRKPSSFQFKTDLRIPISYDWDFNFVINSYKINTDATELNSLNPIDPKVNVRFSGGFIYRFKL